MRADMASSAAAVVVAARLVLPVHAVTAVPFAENRTVPPCPAAGWKDNAWTVSTTREYLLGSV